MKLRLQLAAFGSVAALLLAAPVVLAQGDPAPTPAPTDTVPPPPAPPPPAPAAEGADGGAAPVPAPAPTTETEPPPAPPTPPPPVPPPPTTAPETATGPTVTLTTGSPAVKDTVKKADKKDDGDENKEPNTPIAGSTLSFQTGVSPNVFSPGLQLSPDVTVSSYAAFKPSYAFNKMWAVRSWVSFFYEWTDTADTSTTRKNQPMFGDTPLYLDFRGIPALAGIKTKLTAVISFPTSPESQSRSLYFSPGAGVSFAKAFEHVLGGEVALALATTYSHPIYQYTTGGLQSSPSYAPQCFGGAGGSACNDQVSGAANTENAVSFLGSISAQWGRFNPSVFLLVANGWAYQFKDLTGTGVQPSNDPAHFRQRTFFGASLAYDVVPGGMIQAEVGYQMLRNTILDGDGKVGNPVYSQYNDAMQVYLAVNVALDKFWLKVSGKSSASAATAKTKPVFTNF